jgi:hypothetical protein
MSMRFSARLDTSHHGPQHPCREPGAVADHLTGTHTMMVKCLFVVNRRCIHKGFWESPQIKIQRIQIWPAWRPCSRPSSTCPSVMLGVAVNISHCTAKICRSTIMHVPHSCSDFQWYILCCLSDCTQLPCHLRPDAAVLRYVRKCIESHGGYFEYVL